MGAMTAAGENQIRHAFAGAVAIGEYALRSTTPYIVEVSTEDGRAVYRVAVAPHGRALVCTCPGYRYRGACKHLAMVEQAVAARLRVGHRRDLGWPA